MRLLKPVRAWIWSPFCSLPQRLYSTPSPFCCNLRSNHQMNRPRNRQQRPPREQNRGGRRGPQSGSQIGSVPTIQQVVHGASVSIVLKEDQPTGREVQGSVQDLLTRGNHPRGIKVRLTDGRVGRVQRMATGSTCATQSSSAAPTHQLTHHMVDNSAATPDGPPPRSLADYLPTLQREPDPPIQTSKATFTTATATCPICGLFEGDEVAVSHHVNEHLS